MFPAGFEPTFSEGERSQTYALDRAAKYHCMQLILSFATKPDDGLLTETCRQDKDKI